ncbi:hypothetical protein ONS96_000930 [Cadophora gregata f. sp. sojae]|nr:hypothetical protein ONS96_000930 [Cadophora gregata f. sp. sojae]
MYEAHEAFLLHQALIDSKGSNTSRDIAAVCGIGNMLVVDAVLHESVVNIGVLLDDGAMIAILDVTT